MMINGVDFKIPKQEKPVDVSRNDERKSERVPHNTPHHLEETETTEG